MQFHVFYTEDLSAQIMQDHRRVVSHLGIDVNYHRFPSAATYNQRYTMHGQFMTDILREGRDPVSCFLDADCLPYDADYLARLHAWVLENRSFAGNAQNISHAVTRNRMYAAASMCMIHRDAWRELGNPSLAWTRRPHSFKNLRAQIDTAELLTVRANRVGFKYRLLLPIGFDEEPHWDLGPYGSYGRGTVYPGSWHHFQANQLKDGPTRLWADRVDAILQGSQIVPVHEFANFRRG